MTNLGRYVQVLPPGLYYINKCIYQIKLVSLRTKTLFIPNPNLLTDDKVQVDLQTYLGYRIVDPFVATYGVNGLDNAIRQISTRIVKNLTAKRQLTELISQGSKINKKFKERLNRQVSRAGCVIEYADIYGMTIPVNMIDNMAQSAISKRQKEAKIKISQANFEASKLTQKAAEILKENSSSLSLRHFDNIKEISEDSNRTVILPDGMLYIPKK